MTTQLATRPAFISDTEMGHIYRAAFAGGPPASMDELIERTHIGVRCETQHRLSDEQVAETVAYVICQMRALFC